MFPEAVWTGGRPQLLLRFTSWTPPYLFSGYQASRWGEGVEKSLDGPEPSTSAGAQYQSLLVGV